MPEHLRGPFGVQHLSFDKDGQLFAATESALSRLVEDRWERIFPETKTVALPMQGISPGLHSGIWTATAFGNAVGSIHRHVRLLRTATQWLW